MRIIAVVVLGTLLSPATFAANTKDSDICAGDDDESAIAACTRIITQGKQSRTNLAVAYANRGAAYVRKGDYDHALPDLDEAIRLDPKPASVYYSRGAANQAKKVNDQAIADFAKFISLSPDQPDGYYARAYSYAAKEDFDRAIADYSEAIKLNPDYADAYYGRANAYYEKTDYDRALADYEEVIKHQPDDANAYYGRANAYSMKKDYDRSLIDCERAISLKADWAEAYACRGNVFFQMNDYVAAVADLDKAILTAGKDAWADLYQMRADALSNQGEFDQAIAGYDQSLSLNDKNAEVYRNRGMTLCHKGDYDRGLADFEKVVQLEAEDAFLYNSRAWCLAQKGDLDKSLGDAERAVALRPDDADFIATRGEIYLRRGLLDLALADFDKSVSLDATLVEVYRDRGLAFEQKGDRDHALADYRRALALKPRWVMEHRAQDQALARLTAMATSGQLPPIVSARTEPTPSAPEKRIALVIGNGAYNNVKALKNADSDAQAVAAALRRLGFEIVEKHDLTLAQLTAELKAFGDRAGNFDWAVVYYAGHGIEVGGINYLIPVDAELSAASHVDDEALPLDRVLAKVEGAHKLKLVILDACRENPFIAKMASASGTRSVGRGLARVEPEGGVLVAYSAKEGQVAQDGDGNNSPFAQALLDHLDEPGLEINMMFRRVHDDVKSRTGGQQVPFTYGSLPADPLYFNATRQ